MMSERRFDEWAAFCSKYQWSEDVVKASGGQKPKYLSYCNANNGMLWPSDVRESKTLQTKSAFAEKVAALTK